ncbi:hypothetical protein GCM10010976_25190 [Bizionia arctica]|uniref:Glycosyltransferase n=1 Tax=Bizionia arctica TaxID=1495645 RepID=A0A917LRE7_9FLAO|nr:hypothetical protein GCM10010976_25190 [Bizionia arctica]
MAQENKNFEVLFIDYGSEIEISNQVASFLEAYPFVTYIYTSSEGKPWNRSKAINIGIKLAETDFILSADIDMIFHPSFNGMLTTLSDKSKVTFFKVGYLSEKETFANHEFKPESVSNQRAKGISLYPKPALMSINGFDEFFNCWGSEDEDVIDRLVLNGVSKDFYSEDILVFHQYHKPFKELKNKLLSEDLTFDQVRFHNDKKRKFNSEKRLIKVNNKGWGEVVEKEYYNNLINTPISKTVTSYKTEVDFFLFFELNRLTKGAWAFKFVQFVPERNVNFKSVLYRIWTIRNRDLKAKGEYSLKEVNDLLLKFLLYQGFDFHLKVDLESNSLELRVNIT